jgi:hypothetical protein
MKETKLLTKRKNKTYLQILNDEKKYYKKKSKWKKIILNLLFLILYTILVIFIYSLFTKKKKSSSESDITNIQSYPNDADEEVILKNLTNNDEVLYQKVKNCLDKDPDEQMCIYHLLCPKEVVGKNRVLAGPNQEGGTYVMLDDFDDIKICYSLGIDHNVDFDKAIADRGIDVYMYDHTIDKLPFENPKFHWKKIGVGGNSDRSSNIQTLLDMMKENGHLNEKNMILKIDVEGAEWNTFKDIPEEVLPQFKYILLEYHFYKLEASFIYNILKKIHKTHQPYFVHTNYGSRIINFGNNRMVGCIEVSYIIREGYKFAKDKSVYPLKEYNFIENKGFNPNILKLFDKYVK